jgi:hypothetical protein
MDSWESPHCIAKMRSRCRMVLRHPGRSPTWLRDVEEINTGRNWENVMRQWQSAVFISILTVILTACVSAGVTPIGSNTFTPLPPGSEVLVFSAENQVTVPYKVVGLISYSNPGKYQILSLADVMPDLKEQARKAGANGIIIDESHVIKSGIISTGIGVTARAIVLQR